MAAIDEQPTHVRKGWTNLQHCHGMQLMHSETSGFFGTQPRMTQVPWDVGQAGWTKLPLQRWFPNCNEGLRRFQAASTTVSTVIYSHSDLTMTSTQPPFFAQGTTQATSCQLSTHNGKGQLSHRHLRQYELCSSTRVCLGWQLII